MRPYLILSHDYRRTSAGVRALHGLCHHLNERGCEAWVTSAVVNSEWNTPTADEETVRRVCEEGVVVYPEVEAGNPLGARRVARYILNRPGFVRGEVTFDPGEELFCYCGLLREFVPSEGRILTVPVVDTDVFWNHPVEERRGVVWYGGKGFLGEVIPGMEGATEITLEWPGSWRELAALFRRSDVLVSYTAYTVLVIEARLCECPVLLAGVRYRVKDFDDGGMPGGVYGLGEWTGVGWRDAVELMRARETVAAFAGVYERDMAEFEWQLGQFIRVTQEMGEEGIGSGGGVGLGSD